MKKLIYISSTIFAIFFLTRCDNNKQIIDIKLPEHQPKLVAYAMFTNNQLQETRVFHSLGALDDNYKKIDNANITLLKNDAVIADDFQLRESGTYEPAVYITDTIDFPNQADNYIMKVSATGYETIEAKCIMPTKVFIKEASYDIAAGIDEDGQTADKIKLKFDDPTNEKNFYIFSCPAYYEQTYIDPNTGDTILFTGNYNYLTSIDPRIDQYFISNIFIDSELANSVTLFSDKDFNGQSVEMNFTAYTGLKKEDDIQGSAYPTLYSIPEDMYYFIKSAGQYEKAQDAIFPEPVVIHSNFDNGYGVFGIYQVDKKMIPF